MVPRRPKHKNLNPSALKIMHNTMCDAKHDKNHRNTSALMQPPFKYSADRYAHLSILLIATHI